MKKISILIAMLVLSVVLVACNEEEKEKEPLQPTTYEVNYVKDDSFDNVKKPNGNFTVIEDTLENIYIEIDEEYNLSSLYSKKMTFTIDSDIVKVSSKGVVKGLKTGVAYGILSNGNEKQLVPVKVFEKGELSVDFTIDEYRMKGKKMVCFGDSVTFPASIGGAPTYHELAAESLGMIAVKNYAIGGTTGTYVYEESYIYREYGGGIYAHLSGPEVIYEAYKAGELADIDYAMIMFGHNDQYFQVNMEDDNDEFDIERFDRLNSVEESYRYMIRALRVANPNMRIIIINMTYSQYDVSTIAKNGNDYFGKEVEYSDFQQAVKNVAIREQVKHLNPWNHLVEYFDYNWDGSGKKQYYNDSVHLSPLGHKILAKYIVNAESDLYLVGDMTNWEFDMDYRFNDLSKTSETFNAIFDESHIGQTFIITDKEGNIVLNGYNELFAEYENFRLAENGAIEVLSTGTFKFTYNNKTSNLKCEKIADSRFFYVFRNGTNCYTYEVKLNENNLFEFEYNAMNNTAIQFQYAGKYISVLDTKVSGNYAKGKTTNMLLYTLEGNNTVFFYGNANKTKFVITYNPKTNELNIKIK